MGSKHNKTSTITTEINTMSKTIRDAINVPTKVLFYGLLEVRDDMSQADDFDEEMWLLEVSAARLFTLSRALKFTFSGFIVTNGFWIAHALGYV